MLLHAADHDLIVVTHNRRDFELLHFAWTRWGLVWTVQPNHSGILVLPQQWPVARAVHELTSAANDLDLRNNLFRFDHEHGWYVRSFSRHVVIDEV